MPSFLDSLRKEARAFLLRAGIGGAGIGQAHGLRMVLIHVALLAVFGVFLPWRKGTGFTDPAILSAYMCISVVFAAPSAAEAFSRDAPESLAEASARIAVAVFYGEILVAAMLLVGMFTLVMTLPRGALFPPDLGSLAEAGILGLTASFALSAAAAWMTLRFSAKAARGALRIIFLLLLLLFFYWSRWLPDFAPTGAVGCLVLGTAIVFGLRSLLRRPA